MVLQVGRIILYAGELYVVEELGEYFVNVRHLATGYRRTIVDNPNNSIEFPVVLQYIGQPRVFNARHKDFWVRSVQVNTGDYFILQRVESPIDYHVSTLNKEVIAHYLLAQDFQLVSNGIIVCDNETGTIISETPNISIEKAIEEIKALHVSYDYTMRDNEFATPDYVLVGC